MHATLIVFSSRDITTYPAVLNWISILHSRGWSIDLIANEKMKTVEQFQVSQCYWLPDEKYDFYQQTRLLLKNRGTTDTWLIVFQIEGLFAAASILGNNHSARIIYVSLELVYKNYLRRAYANFSFLLFVGAHLVLVAVAKEKLSVWLKRLAVALFEASSWLKLKKYGTDLLYCGIAQDKERERLLKAELSFIRRIVTVPNAYMETEVNDSRWAHDYFGLDHAKKILLFAGMMEEGFDQDLLAEVTKLSDEYVTIVHAYSRDGYLDRIGGVLENGVASGRIIVNRQMLAESDYNSLVSSCRIGLVWYAPPDTRDENMYYLGLSSGKLCKYLSRGKPVIAQRGFHGYADLIDENGIGVTCSSAMELPEAVAAIEKKYDAMQHALLNFVGAHLNVTDKIGRIVADMESEV